MSARWRLVPTVVTPAILGADNAEGEGWIIKDQGEWASLLKAAPPASDDADLVQALTLHLCKENGDDYGLYLSAEMRRHVRAVLSYLEGAQ